MALPSNASINLVNYLNIVFMVFSLIAAQCMPFEVFLFSYAVLGPAHYLTEISWLHDRKFFCPRTYDIVFFLLSGLTLFILPFFFLESANRIYDVIIIGTFLSAAVFISPLRGFNRSCLVCICFLVALTLQTLGPISTLVALYLPTLVHGTL